MNVQIPPALLSVIALSIGALAVLAFTSPLTRNSLWLSAVGGVAIVAAVIPSLRADGATLAATLTVLAAAFVAMLLLQSVELEDPGQKPEIAALLLLGAAGGIVFATANDLLSAVVGLETLSLTGATLAALTRGTRPLEAAFKYFVLASISVAVLLFGIGLVYLATGSFAWPTLASAEPAYRWLLLAGVLLVGLGFAYELALVPLHFGSVDVYTAGAPSLTGFVMAASKVAAVIALSRLIGSVSQGLQTPLPLSGVLVIIGLISIVAGTLAALVQTDLRRLLAYSAVANAGFLALALGCGAEGRAAAIFYVVTYATTAVLVFAALAGRGAGPLALSDVKLEGLGALRALALVLGLLSLAGIPPTPGFWAKLAVLDAAWSAIGFWPTLIAALGGVFGALYYLKPLPDLLAVVRAAGATRLPASSAPAVVLAGAVVVFAAVAPGIVYALARLATGG
ncbi:MAG: proton-conducting transporter membrane subunit [Chloroflexota bacterium]